MSRILVVLMILTMTTVTFGSQIEKERERIQETQTKLKSASAPLEITITGGEKISGTVTAFEEETFLFMNLVTEEIRSIHYLSVDNIKQIKCLCKDSTDTIRALSGTRKQIEVELIDSSKWKGLVVETDASSFVLMNRATSKTHRMTYSTVKKIDARSEDAKFAKQLFIIGGIAIASLVVAIHFFVPYT